jgi:hypothetical protein
MPAAASILLTHSGLALQGTVGVKGIAGKLLHAASQQAKFTTADYSR